MATHILQYVTGLVLAGLIGELQPQGDVDLAPPIGGVRASDARIENLIREGCGKSATFLALVQELRSSNWIVFVQSGSCPIAGIPGCLLHRVGTFQHHKYLRIIIGGTPSSDAEAIGTIGHELQHALEVVRNRHVADGLDIRDLYRRIGYVARRTRGTEIYETAAAAKARATVFEELRAFGRRDHVTVITGQDGCGESSVRCRHGSLECLRDEEQPQAVLPDVKTTSARGGTQIRSCSTP